MIAITTLIALGLMAVRHGHARGVVITAAGDGTEIPDTMEIPPRIPSSFTMKQRRFVKSWLLSAASTMP